LSLPAGESAAKAHRVKLKPLPVRLDQLISALDESESSSSVAYLDLQTGDLEFVPNPDAGDAYEVDLSEFADIVSAPGRWARLEPLESWLRFDVRRRFVDSVDDPQLRLQLSDALDQSRGALAQFARLLRMNVRVRDAWFSFRDRALEAPARARLARLGVQPV
jgi:hypothetical protein